MYAHAHIAISLTLPVHAHGKAAYYSIDTRGGACRVGCVGAKNNEIHTHARARKERHGWGGTKKRDKEET